MVGYKNTDLLNIEDLRVHYQLASGEVLRAVDGVSFSVSPAERLGLVGESGCGKTTLGKAILGILPENGRIENGKIVFQGKDVLRFSEMG